MMRYTALATDYDGTLASQGKVDATVVAALDRFREAGRILILVTGRELDELLRIFPEVTLFHRVVAENGGLLYCPQSGRQKVLGEPPSSELVRTLIDRGVQPLSVGRSIVATFEPHESTVLAAIRDLGLELQVIFNKGAVMVLPAGVNKATGLAAALDDLGVSMRNVVSIGDAENDHAMLRASECGIAVANALTSLKDEADYTSMHRQGEAVIEAMEAVLRDDLSSLPVKSKRRLLRLGTQADGTPLMLPEAHSAVMVTGSDGSRVLTYLGALVEQLVDDGYQACIFDFEGKLARARGTITLGTSKRPPSIDEVRAALRDTPAESVVVNLCGQRSSARDRFVVSLFEECLNLRRTHGRPHWCIFADAPETLVPRLRSLDREAHSFGILYGGVDLDSAQFPWARRVYATVAIAPDSLQSRKCNITGNVGGDVQGAEAAFQSSLRGDHVIGFSPHVATS